MSAPIEIVWKGHLSTCKTYGHVFRFILEVLDNTSEYFALAAPCCDGFVKEPHEQNLTLGSYAIQYYKKQAIETPRNPKLIMASISTRDCNEAIVLVPIDDDSFKYGVKPTLLKEVSLIPWNEKKAIAYWRGHASGFPMPNIRKKTVLKLIENANADVKFIKEAVLEDFTNPKYYADKVTTQEFLKYKYILIIDGTVIASSLQWTFASGSVPILVTHPNNNWWFKKYLIPMVHYVPVAYDLSDIDSQIQWLIDNDDKAHHIARNAMQFSEEYLSTEFQQKYLTEQLLLNIGNRGETS
jgi:hypothetical protein